MTNDELRALADCLDDPNAMQRTARRKSADYLRAQADAQPVAWSDGLGSFIAADEKVGDDPDILAYRVPLYAQPTPAAPQAEPKREPLDDDEISRLAWQQNVWTDGMIEFSFLAFARAVERAHGISGGGHD